MERNKMECKNLDEIRNNIDRIDNQIIKLIAERGNFVKQASKFKKNSQEVQAPQRVEAVISKVRKLSCEYGTNPDRVEKLYRNMITGFIDLEVGEFNNAK
jgi:isochorismate pyruvate lyase